MEIEKPRPARELSAARALDFGFSELPPSFSADGSPEEAASLGDYFNIARRNWRLVAISLVAGLALGVLPSFFLPSMYRAYATLEIQNINGDFLNMKQARSMDEEEQGMGALTDLQTQTEILQSDMLADSTILLLKGRHVLKGLHVPRFAGANVNREEQESAIFDRMRKSLKVGSVGQTRLIRVQVDAFDPGLAADFANTLVGEYILQNRKARWQMTEAAGEFTKVQLAQTRQKLDTSQNILQEYAIAHQLLAASDRRDISNGQVRQVQLELLTAQADLTSKEARRQVALSAGPDAIPEVLKDPDLQKLRSVLGDLERQNAELSVIFKPDYSETRKVKAQIEEVKAAIDSEKQRIATRIDNEYAESSDRVKLLQASYNAEMRRAVLDGQTEVQYEILKRDVDTNLADYQSMLARSKELTLANAIQTSNVRVIDKAKPPETAYSPKISLNVALGGLSGLMLSLAFVIVRDRSNRNLRHPGESMLRLGIPELAVIAPTVTTGVSFQRLGGTDMMAQLEGGTAGADDFRSLLTSILFAHGQESQPKVVVVTSCATQDGKTTISSHLSAALARAGKKVLLIDGDLRRPQIHRLFGLSNEHGLSNLLENGVQSKEAQDAVLETTIPGLSVLPSGSGTAAPADLLFDPHVGVLLAAYRHRYDMVIIDSPPMMRIPDARLLGNYADAVALVVRANRTPRTAILLARQRLALDGTRLLGVVLNDCPLDMVPTYYEA